MTVSDPGFSENVLCDFRAKNPPHFSVPGRVGPLTRQNQALEGELPDFRFFPPAFPFLPEGRKPAPSGTGRVKTTRRRVKITPEIKIGVSFSKNPEKKPFEPKTEGPPDGNDPNPEIGFFRSETRSRGRFRENPKDRSRTSPGTVSQESAKNPSFLGFIRNNYKRCT